jgi:glutamate-1-semialdehyde 2,1-aminomutase
LCNEFSVLLIFDEVISGFRVAFGGASELYGIYPDIVTYGKIIGGGLPVGAYGARKEIMQCVSPDGPVYQAGTLSGNPVAMAAGLAQLKQCSKDGFYRDLAMKTTSFIEDINSFCGEYNFPLEMISIGSIFWFSFNGKKRILISSQIDPDMTNFNKLHHYLLNQGVYLGPSGYEVGFVSNKHDQFILQLAAQKIKEWIKTLNS